MIDEDKTPDWQPHVPPPHHAPEPVSHVDFNIPSTLYGLLDAAQHWRETARDYRHQPGYHRVVAGLRQYQRVLADELVAYPESVVLRTVLAEIETYTGKAHS